MQVCWQCPGYDSIVLVDPLQVFERVLPDLDTRSVHVIHDPGTP
jgi:hypothetical protein